MTGNFAQRGGFWVLGQSMLMLAVIISAVIWPGKERSLLLTIYAALFFLTAAACGISGAMALGRNLTPFPRPSAHTRLVQHGIYGLIRHPLYTAGICGATGWALLWASWPAMVAAVTLAVFFDAKARQEEHWLQQQFPEYGGYAQRVRRFVPWLY